jgi:hypothetical protein
LGHKKKRKKKEKERQNKTAMTGIPEQEGQDRAASTGLLG